MNYDSELEGPYQRRMKEEDKFREWFEVNELNLFEEFNNLPAVALTFDEWVWDKWQEIDRWPD